MRTRRHWYCAHEWRIMRASFAAQPNSRRRALQVAECWSPSVGRSPRLRLPVAPGVAAARRIIIGSVPLGALRETCGDTRLFDVGRVRPAGRFRYAQPHASSTDAGVLRLAKVDAGFDYKAVRDDAGALRLTGANPRRDFRPMRDSQISSATAASSRSSAAPASGPGAFAAGPTGRPVGANRVRRDDLSRT